MKLGTFSDRFSKNTQVSNFMKIRPMGVELFHADRWTDTHDEANGRFPQFWEGASLESTEFIEDTCRGSKIVGHNTQKEIVDFHSTYYKNSMKALG